MQTDPNWGNFLYDEQRDVLNLIDFGAAREYPVAFVDDYLRMVRACALQCGEEVVERSTRLGFLTGAPAAQLQAHVHGPNCMVRACALQRGREMVKRSTRLNSLTGAPPCSWELF